MVYAQVLYPDQSTERIDHVEALAGIAKSRPQALWIDLEAPSEAELSRVADLFKLDPAAIEDCLHGEQHPRVDELDELLFLVFYGAVGPGAEPTFEPRKLAAFCGSSLLITVHRDSLRTVQNVRKRCDRKTAQLLSTGTDFILYLLLDGIVDNYGLVVESLSSRLDDLEDLSVSPSVDESILGMILNLRRELLELRRIAVSQGEILQPFASGEYDFISDDLQNRFSHVRDHLTKTVELTEGLRELLNGVRDNYHAALANRLNNVMKTLTIFATLFLPLSLLAGIYGMNTPLWPDASNPLTFWFIIGAMVIVAAGMVIYFSFRKWM